MPPHPTQCWVGQWQVDEDARWLRTDHERIPPDSRYPWGKSPFFSNIVWGAGAQHCVGCGGIAWKQYRFHEKRCEKMLILITFSHIHLKNGCIWILIKWSYVDSDWSLIENTCFHRGKCISLVCVQWFTSSVLKPVCPWPILRRATNVFVDSRHNKIYQHILNFFQNFRKK